MMRIDPFDELENIQQLTELALVRDLKHPHIADAEW